MKVRPGSGRRCSYAVPLPTALLFSCAFFLAGYYISLVTHEDIAVEEVAAQAQRKHLLENGLNFPFDHGESGDGLINDIPFQILSWKPRSLLLPNFAGKEECEHIIDLAKSRLSPSGLALRKGETSGSTKDVRTRGHSMQVHNFEASQCKNGTYNAFDMLLWQGSSGTFLAWHNDKKGVLARLEEKMARATMLPRTNGEAFNVLRYQLGQKYDAHYDVFNPAEYGPQKSQRIASILLYLSNVEEGGDTMFPFENYQNMRGYDYKQCIGLRVKPRQGDALLFYSVHPNGTFDAAALHGSCPVLKGEKWVATKWIRDHPEF